MIYIDPQRLRTAAGRVQAIVATATSDEAAAVSVQEVLRELVEHYASEQEQMGLDMHRAYRPEVVSEVAVFLGEDSDWNGVARWCGGTVNSGPDGTDSGEWTSWIEVPGVGTAPEGTWLVKRLDGTFDVRVEVGAPDGDTLANARRQGGNAALLDFARAVKALPSAEDHWTRAQAADEAEKWAEEKFPAHERVKADQ